MTASPVDADVLTALSRTASELAATAGPSVVTIGRDGRGSGVVIATDRVLTSAHNLRDRTTEVTLADGTAHQGELVAADLGGDLAVVAVDTGGARPLDWSDQLPGVGDVVFALSRGRRRARLTVGLVSGVERTFRGPRGRPIAGAIEHSAPLGRGATGGPVVDRSGRVVAVNTHRLDDGFALARPADEALRTRVAALLDGTTPAALTLGVAVAPPQVARRLRRSVGLPERDGLLVRGVDADGPAARAGVDVGDLVVAAAGRELASVDDLFEALADHDPDQTLLLGVVRGVEELELAVSFSAEGPREEGRA